MYMGSASVETVERFVMGEYRTVRYVPALSKMIDEIIDNSIDEAIRTNFKHATKINVSVDGDKITVTDNGRGIPQEEVTDPNTGETILRPVAAWTRVNAGTSFDDDGRVSIGANGVGSSCTNFLSTRFEGRTWQKGQMVEVLCDDGGLETTVNTKKKTGNGTEVSFIPDFSLMEVDSVSELDTITLIEHRLNSLQMAMPEITFSFNGKKVEASNLKKYSSMFVKSDKETVVTSQTDNLAFFFAASEDGFRTDSFINGVNTRQGGSYVNFIVDSVVDELTGMIKRKHKIEVVKATIKGGLTFVMFARNFVDPRYDSQTKERLTSPAGSVKTHYEGANGPDFKYLARKIMAAEDIIGPIIEAQLAKKLAAEKRAATLEQKKLKKVKVAKHIAASSPNATLILCEGDSAASSALETRDPKKVGVYPLRGVVKNVWNLTPSQVLTNKELSELVAILGLDINKPASHMEMNYAKVAIMCDADKDGYHIATLLVAFFYKFWPNLVRDGKLSIVRSPIMISSKGKDVKWFYTYSEANEFKKKDNGYKNRYIKGLGSLQKDEYSKIINDPVLDVITVREDEKHLFDMMFSDDTNLRKEFMS